MTTQHYDVAVLGMQPAGLIAGALLAKRGRRVLLVDHGQERATYRRRGLRLPLAPTFPTTFDHIPAVDRVHAELGLGPELRTALSPLDPAFQLILPQHRLDVRADRRAFLAEVRLEFGEVAEQLGHIFERLDHLDGEIGAALKKEPHLPPAGIFEKLRSRAFLSHHAHLDAPFEGHDVLHALPRYHPLRAILFAPLPFLSHLGDEQPSTVQAARLISRAFRGGVLFSDELSGWLGFLLAGAERAGVETRRPAVLSGVGSEGRKITELRLEDSNDRATADLFIDNGLDDLPQLLGQVPGSTKLVVDESRTPQVAALLTFNFVVDKRLVPRALAKAALLFNGRNEPRADDPPDGPVLLRRYPAERGELDSGTASRPISDPDSEVLACATVARLADVKNAPERFAMLRRGVEQRLARVAPFLRDFLRDSSAAVDTAGWDSSGQVGVRVDPWRIHPIYAPAKRPAFGVGARSPRTYFKNLWHAGHDVLPGLGLEGDYLTGLRLAAELERRGAKG